MMISKSSLHLVLFRKDIRISHTFKSPCISDLLIKSSNEETRNEKTKEADTNSEQTNSEFECHQNLKNDDMNNISINSFGDGGNFDSLTKNTVYAADSDSDTNQEPKTTPSSSTMKELNAFFEKVLVSKDL